MYAKNSIGSLKMAKKKKENQKSPKEVTKFKDTNFTFEDHVSKVTISKNASPGILQLLSNCNFNCQVVIKK